MFAIGFQCLIELFGDFACATVEASISLQEYMEHHNVGGESEYLLTPRI